MKRVIKHTIGNIVSVEMNLPVSLHAIAEYLATKGLRAVVVGGAVRDALLSIECKDWDIEVYNTETIEALESVLSDFGTVNSVGKSFGVLKLKVDNYEYDFSLPRVEKKVALGHKGFSVEHNGALDFEEAARRRDFTINALGYDILQKRVLDPYSGKRDLEQRVLRVVDAKTFVDDPLRLYRAIQFAARFEFKLESKTKALCRQMLASGMLDELPKERVWGEWQKSLLKAKKPSIAFELMRELGVLKHYFPELFAIIGIEQEPKYHPEGDVWVHTMMSLDKMVALLNNNKIEDDKIKLKLLLATLCHDLGKATTTEIIDGRIRSIGHEKAGVEPTRKLLYRLTNEHSFIEDILPLVEHHLKPAQLFIGAAKAAAIRRLAKRVKISELVMVATADFLGRTTKEAQSGYFEAGEWLLEQAKELKVAVKPLDNIVTGKDLIALGISPSPLFSKILDDVYNKLIEGSLKSKDEALGYIAKHYCTCKG